MWLVSAWRFQLLPADFAQVICRRFWQGRFLVIGADAEPLRRQFAENGREAVIIESCNDLSRTLSGYKGPSDFDMALWCYSGEDSNHHDVVKEFSRRASD